MFPGLRAPHLPVWPALTTRYFAVEMASGPGRDSAPCPLGAFLKAQDAVNATEEGMFSLLTIGYAQRST